MSIPLRYGTTLEKEVAKKLGIQPLYTCQFLLGTVQRRTRINVAVHNNRIVSIPLRYGTTCKPSLRMKSQLLSLVSIPLRYGTT